MAGDPLRRLRREFRGEKDDLIPVLQKTQEALGYLPPEALRGIARWLKISEHEIFGVTTFYAQFRFCPPGRHEIKVCLGTACHVKGGEQMLDVLERRLGIQPGQTSADGEYNLERVACLGCCALAPVVTIGRRIYSQLSVLKLQGILDDRDQA